MSDDGSFSSGCSSDDGGKHHDKSTSSSSESTMIDSTGHSSSSLIGYHESKMVKRAKVLVLFVLFLATTIVAVLAYKFTKQDAEQVFELQFEDSATAIVEGSQVNTAHVHSILKSMSLHLTAHAISSQSHWPFITLPLYEAQVDEVIHETGAQYVAFAPFVSQNDRVIWEEYTKEHQDWVEESLAYSGLVDDMEDSSTVPIVSEHIMGESVNSSVYVPIWQVAPILGNVDLVNSNAMESTPLSQDIFSPTKSVIDTTKVLKKKDEIAVMPSAFPESTLITPVYDSIGKESNLVALLFASIPSHTLFIRQVADHFDGIVLVMKNNCDDFVATYEIHGSEIVFVGEGDLHDSTFDRFEIFADDSLYTTWSGCVSSLHVFPSEHLHAQYKSNHPILYTVAVVLIFVITASVFILYDNYVARRQHKVLTTATRSNAIVNSLFPANVRDRLLEDITGQQRDLGDKKKKFMSETSPKLFEQVKVVQSAGKPIAEMFANATVLFADICGFTAWSSVRDPAQVFVLLESVYNSFDKIARKRKVFKVETIGDCYVAVTGLPVPREDHAVVMSKFARDCLEMMNRVVLDLEIRLGPETSDLTMRFGLHSGPVIGGVLRGEKSRFQLFGDTVNTSARMESTGARNRVQISQNTADLLVAAGKSHWVRPRDNLVQVKGKGLMKTYWLSFRAASTVSDRSHSERDEALPKQNQKMSIDGKVPSTGERHEALVGWNADVLGKFLKRIIAMRDEEAMNRDSRNLRNEAGSDSTVLDEVKEVIMLPNEAHENKVDPNLVELDEAVTEQLHHYVRTISTMYNGNPFHCFAHASHVVQSVVKLLVRIIIKQTIDFQKMSCEYKKGDAILHESTFGITSDPLTQFACVFAALIHDVDHLGVPNAVLVKEETEVAMHYKNKSVAEQNSVDLAWELLMEPKYKDLRACIYTNQDELNRFRQLIVNSVMATDICDKELGALRRDRWEKAFSPARVALLTESAKVAVNRKATIVIEHLIQASDVSHTMQHWHVYIKWNERLFHEMYKAWKEGRIEKDPSEGWYQGELGFFDFYIIPLAKKLDSCGVFGVSSDEYLNYAVSNRRQWESVGHDIVKGYLSKYETTTATATSFSSTTTTTTTTSAGQ